MEQKSLRVLDANKTFFSKITSTITKILIPTRLGINNMMISIYLVIVVREQISMPISSIKKNVSVKIPISMDIVRGEVPSYYGYGNR